MQRTLSYSYIDNIDMNIIYSIVHIYSIIIVQIFPSRLNL